jgi:hypothetical protein
MHSFYVFAVRVCNFLSNGNQRKSCLENVGEIAYRYVATCNLKAWQIVFCVSEIKAENCFLVYPVRIIIRKHDFVFQVQGPML